MGIRSIVDGIVNKLVQEKIIYIGTWKIGFFNRKTNVNCRNNDWENKHGVP